MNENRKIGGMGSFLLYAFSGTMDLISFIPGANVVVSIITWPTLFIWFKLIDHRIHFFAGKRAAKKTSRIILMLVAETVPILSFYPGYTHLTHTLLKESRTLDKEEAELVAAQIEEEERAFMRRQELLEADMLAADEEAYRRAA